MSGTLVLGVDPGWTASGNWGLALVEDGALTAVARSCREMLDGLGSGRGPAWDESAPPGGGLAGVLGAAGRGLAAVALDVPLGPEPIRGRRPADAAVSREWGRCGAAVHSPLPGRPGEVSAELFQALTAAGLRWAGPGAAGSRVFLETYPHPAIIRLLELDYRLPYKVSRRHRYWPGCPPEQRWERLAVEMDRLRAGLATVLPGVRERVPPAATILAGPGRLRRAQGLENALDAVVCAWVGWRFLQGGCQGVGDERGVIWLPAPPGREATGRPGRP